MTWLWKITMSNRKTHYKWPFSRAMLNYQRIVIERDHLLFQISFIFTSWDNECPCLISFREVGRTVKTAESLLRSQSRKTLIDVRQHVRIFGQFFFRNTAAIWYKYLFTHRICIHICNSIYTYDIHMMYICFFIYV